MNGIAEVDEIMQCLSQSHPELLVLFGSYIDISRNIGLVSWIGYANGIIYVNTCGQWNQLRGTILTTTWLFRADTRKATWPKVFYTGGRIMEQI